MEKWKTTNRFPTFPHATSDDDSWSKLKTQNVRKEVGRCAASSPSLFHDHLVLETIPCFMIILRLENAGVTLQHVVRCDSLPLHHRDPFDRLLIASVDVTAS
jgi:hypothetical protein